MGIHIHPDLMKNTVNYISYGMVLRLGDTNMKMERTKINKNKFEIELVKMFSKDNLSQRKHSERGLDKKTGEIKNTTMTLYYNEDIHVGTWCDGFGWVF